MLTPLSEVRAKLLEGRLPLAPVRLDAAHALGCVLAERVVASEAVPPFAASAMDGYALHAADTTPAPVTLRVAGETMAGDAPAGKVGVGEAVRIMTGAPMPSGADAVCMLEDTEREGEGAVHVRRELSPGANVRPAGGDVEAGAVVFEPGTVLTPAHMGVLSSLGVIEVLAVPRPRVGVLSTGNELTSGPAPLRPGQIRESNRPALLALVSSSGFCPVDLGRVGDTEDEISTALRSAAGRCDAVLTTGGVSVGDRDLVTGVLDTLGAGSALSFKVAVKPAKPFAFAEIGPERMPLFGLPGNPVSALVGFEIYARPVLRRMAGHAGLDRPHLRGIADQDLRREPDGKTHFVRVKAAHGSDGRVHVRSSGRQDSHLLRVMSTSNALAVLYDGVGVAAGEEMDVWLLDAGEMPSVGPATT